MIVTDDKIISLVGFARQMNCTDIHISMDHPVVLRKMGELIKTNFEANNEDIKKMIMSIVDEEQKNLINESKDVITTFEMPKPQPFRQRVCIYKQMGKLAASIRLLPHSTIPIEELNIPESVITELLRPSGITFITGPAGNGKTTTAASLIQQICNTNPMHIITLEEPIEYVFRSTKSTVHQRQIGTDIDSFSKACEYASKEDTDIIFISDIRDFDTLNAAVKAAESGHAVIACYNANSIIHALDSLEELCPTQRQERFRIRFSNVIRSMITQKLVPSADGTSTVIVNEVMICNDAIANVLRQEKRTAITNIMQTSSALGMHTLNSILVKLCGSGTITRESAIRCSADRDDLLQYLK